MRKQIPSQDVPDSLVDELLAHLGYSEVGTRSDMVAEYQTFHGLRVDGDAGVVTRAHMTQPRCGHPDLIRREAGLCKWTISELSYAFDIGSLRQSGSYSIAEVVRESFKAWESVCGLAFNDEDDSNSSNIEAKPGTMSSGTLAWAYLGCGFGPRDTSEQEYNRSVTWSRALLLDTLIHEIGHSIGLDHSSDQNSIMYPTANGQRGRLSAGDIAEAVERYGVNETKPDPGDAVFTATVRVDGRSYTATATMDVL